MEKILIQVVVNAAALWVAVQVVDGIEFGGEWWELLIVALIFALVNTFLRPVLRIVTLPITIITLGLFLLVINALLLLLTGMVAVDLGLGFVVDGFLPAVLGAIIISLVSLAITMVLRTARIGRRVI